MTLFFLILTLIKVNCFKNQYFLVVYLSALWWTNNNLAAWNLFQAVKTYWQPLHLTSSGFPAPTTMSLPSSRPTRIWLLSFVTDTQRTGTFRAKGATARFKLHTRKDREQETWEWEANMDPAAEDLLWWHKGFIKNASTTMGKNIKEYDQTCRAKLSSCMPTLLKSLMFTKAAICLIKNTVKMLIFLNIIAI